MKDNNKIGPKQKRRDKKKGREKGGHKRRKEARRKGYLWNKILHIRIYIKSS